MKKGGQQQGGQQVCMSAACPVEWLRRCDSLRPTFVTTSIPRRSVDVPGCLVAQNTFL